MSAFEFSPEELRERLEEIVGETFGDLQSQFLVLPRGRSCLDYAGFQDAYEVLRQNTDGFSYLTEDAVWSALREDSLVLVVLRTILGVSPAEWADLARSELGSDVTQGHAHSLDVKVRQDRELFSRWLGSAEYVGLKRAKALISVAVGYITRGAPEASEKETVHRLAQVRASLSMKWPGNGISTYSPAFRPVRIGEAFRLGSGECNPTPGIVAPERPRDHSSSTSKYVGRFGRSLPSAHGRLSNSLLALRCTAKTNDQDSPRPASV